MDTKILKPQLVRLIADQAGETIAISTKVYDAFLLVIQDLLVEGLDVPMVGLGTFKGDNIVKATQPKLVQDFQKGGKRMSNGTPIHYRPKFEYSGALIERIKEASLDNVRAE